MLPAWCSDASPEFATVHNDSLPPMTVNKNEIASFPESENKEAGKGAQLIVHERFEREDT